MPRLPKPFKRPGISISDGSPKKEWMEIQARDINPGDLVAGVGKIEKIEVFEDPYKIAATNVFGETHVLSPALPVMAFRVPLSDGHAAGEDVLRG